MNNDCVRKILDEIVIAERLLAELKAEASTLNLGHQDPIAVSIPKKTRWLGVAENGGRENGWSARLVRGREMIMLGIKLAYAAMIEQQERYLSRLKKDLLEECKS